MSDENKTPKPQTTNIDGNVDSVYNIGEVHGDVNVTKSASLDCHELITQILSNTYRRAFHFNFKFRFVEASEFTEVIQSIRDCRIFLQSNMVRVSATCGKDLLDIVQDMFRQVQLMEAIFSRMQPFINNYARIDHGDPPEMMDIFTEMEGVRVEFMLNIKAVSERAGVPLPSIPSDDGVVFGLDGFLRFTKNTSLTETSVKDLADALKEWRQGMKRSEDNQ